MFREVVAAAAANSAQICVHIRRWQSVLAVLVQKSQFVQNELSLTAFVLEQSCHVGVGLPATARHLIGHKDTILFIPEKYLFIQNTILFKKMTKSQKLGTFFCF